MAKATYRKEGLFGLLVPRRDESITVTGGKCGGSRQALKLGEQAESSELEQQISETES